MSEAPPQAAYFGKRVAIVEREPEPGGGGRSHPYIEMVFNHPTLGETFKYAAYDALAQLGSA